jgi:hypothetical protein
VAQRNPFFGGPHSLTPSTSTGSLKQLATQLCDDQHQRDANQNCTGKP